MQNEKLQKYLEKRNCFKLICAANNENYKEIENLVALYSSIGCKFFDINASKDALCAAKKGLDYSKKDDCFICVSVGADNDPHFAKFKIDNEKCIKCKKCIANCPQDAISKTENGVIIDEKKCIGCKKCTKICKKNAIIKYQKTTSLEKILPEIKNYCDCIEFHIVVDNICEIDEKWDYLCQNYDGFLSISINRSLYSDSALINQLKKMTSKRKPYTTIIQADGVSMAGVDDNYRTTLQALAISDIIDKADLNTYILTSGGVNSKTKKLLEKFKIKTDGIAMGTYARKIVKKYTSCDDFLEDEKKFKKAQKIASELIRKFI